MQRRPDWQSAFDEFLVANRATPFVWGKWDCCLFVADAIRTITGEDLASGLRASYSSLREARWTLRAKYGSASIERSVARLFSVAAFPEIAPQLAHRGDPVIARRGRDFQIGVMGLDGSIVINSETKGLVLAHFSVSNRQRNDRQADFRCGANPQRGESSWASRQKIYNPSPTSLPPATSVIATNFGARFPDLTVPKNRAFMDTRLTAMRTENGMETAMWKEIDELSRMTVGQLRQKYIEAFGEESRSNHKQFLFRRIAWRIQALAEGGLSERARRRALETANDADLRLRAPKAKFGDDVALDPRLSVSRKVAGALDPRLPPPGTYLEREYKGRRIIAKILEDGFEFGGEIYRSLSAIAQEATGTKWNGFLFFNLTAEENLNGKA